MDTADRPAADRRAHDTRSPFDRFVEFAQRHVSHSGAFMVAIVVIVLWALSYPLFAHTAEWHALIEDIAAVATLLLLVLLENAGRRADQAAQEKLNVLSEALAVLLEERAAARPQDDEAHDALMTQARALHTAVGLDERH